MHLHDYLREFHIALSDEISAAREQGGRKITIADGRYLGSRDRYFLYSFTTDSELKFPDDTPVDLELRGQKIRGYILSVHQFDLILGLEEHIGNEVASARLSTEPWFLLEELKKRLENVAANTSEENALIEQLLDRSTTGQTADVRAAERLLASVERETGRNISVNEYQRLAVGHVLRNPISFIWGPPGTGKTFTLGATVAALVADGKSVLVMSHSNVAVDVAMLSIARILDYSQVYRDNRILRLGVYYHTELENYPELHIRGVVHRHNPQLVRELEALEEELRQLTRLSRKDSLSMLRKGQIKHELEQVRGKIAPLREKLRQIEQEYAAHAMVIGCTLSKASIDETIYQRKYDAVLIDEASMVYIPHCAFATSLAREHVAIFGDFRQLPPISQAASPLAQRWLQRDIFEQAGIVDKVNNRHGDSRLVLLATQYRMHPRISAIPNKLFYGGRLLDGPNVEKATSTITRAEPFAGNAVTLCDFAYLGCNNYHTPQALGYSRFNLISAIITVNITWRVLYESNCSLGIVTPYNAQARLIRNLLTDLDLRASDRVTVDTVHRFQGSEQQIILFDTVEAGNSRKPGKLLEGGMGSTAMRLANVAISRTKGKFILLADRGHIRNNFRPQDSFKQFVQEIEERGEVVTARWPAYDRSGIWADTLPLITIEQKPSNSRNQSRLGQRGNELPAIAKQPSGLEIIQIDDDTLTFAVATTNPYGPPIQLRTPKTIQLLTEFWELNASSNGEQRQQPDTSQTRLTHLPVGRVCPECQNPLVPRVGRYGPYLKCSNRHCEHREAITKEDATHLASYLNLKCERCGGQAIGQKGRSVFIGCRNYPKCKWKISLSDILKNRPISS